MTVRQCDVLVIGSGPGGSLTAWKFAQSGYSVLVAEEGPEVSSTRNYSLDEMNRKYRNGGLTVAMGNAKLTYAEACCVGGGTEVNAGLYHRIGSEVLKEWREEFNLTDFTDDSLIPYAEEVERELSVSAFPGPQDPGSERIEIGSKALNWESMEVLRWIRYSQDKDGAVIQERQTATKTHLAWARTAGCEVLSCCRILRLGFQGRQAVVAEGQITHPDGRIEAIKIEFKTVFVCGGPIHTPYLLQKSGLGGKIGRTLQMHPMARIVASFPDKIYRPEAGVPPRQVTEFKPAMTLGGSASTLPHLALWSEGAATNEKFLEGWQSSAVFYTLIRSRTLGSVKPLPLFNEPLVSYSLTREDWRALGIGLYKLCQLLFAAGAISLRLPVKGYAPATSLSDVEKLQNDLPSGSCETTAIHLFGSCPLGGPKVATPLDAYGKVRSCDNVYVNDASMIPTPTGVNPQGTLLAVAKRNLAHILANAPFNRKSQSPS